MKPPLTYRRNLLQKVYWVGGGTFVSNVYMISFYYWIEDSSTTKFSYLVEILLKDLYQGLLCQVYVSQTYKLISVSPTEDQWSLKDFPSNFMSPRPSSIPSLICLPDSLFVHSMNSCTCNGHYPSLQQKLFTWVKSKDQRISLLDKIKQNKI